MHWNSDILRNTNKSWTEPPHVWSSIICLCWLYMETSSTCWAPLIKWYMYSSACYGMFKQLSYKWTQAYIVTAIKEAKNDLWWTALSCSVSLWHEEINGNIGAHVGHKCKHWRPEAALMRTKATFTKMASDLMNPGRLVLYLLSLDTQ